MQMIYTHIPSLTLAHINWSFTTSMLYMWSSEKKFNSQMCPVKLLLCMTQWDLLPKKCVPPKEIMTHSFLAKSIVCYKGIQLCVIHKNETRARNKKQKLWASTSVGVEVNCSRPKSLWNFFFICQQRMWKTKQMKRNTHRFQKRKPLFFIFSLSLSHCLYLNSDECVLFVCFSHTLTEFLLLL